MCLTSGSSCTTVFALPFPLILKLQILQPREKAGLCFLFLLGLITIGVSTARFVLNISNVYATSTCKRSSSSSPNHLTLHDIHTANMNFAK
jgi:hypothetical protein